MTQFEFAQGATPITPEDLEGLKLKHITTCGELDRWEQENIQEAIEWLKRRRKSEILDEKFLCQLHEKMFSKVWKWAGKLRRADTNIGIEWTKISLEMRKLLDDVKFWIEHKTFDVDEIACRFHHRLVAIHPFSNGNGRHSRLITDLLISEMLNYKAFTWGSGNLIEANELRKEYINALKAADKGDYSLLKDFVRS